MQLFSRHCGLSFTLHCLRPYTEMEHSISQLITNENLLISTYLALTLTTWSSSSIIDLRTLSSHGKTFESKDGFVWLALPKQWFLHFYLVGIVSILVLAVFIDSTTISYTTPFVVLQVLRRCYECLYIHAWRPDSKMYLPAYAVGLSHYILLPWNLVISSAKLRHSATLFFLGAMLCVYAQYQQHLHHCLLAKLREGQSSSHYLLPAGGWFDRIGSPQYLAEILIYTGFLLMLQTKGAAALLLWVASNQTLNSWRTHKWYLDQFEDYKKQNRKALIPYLF
jgi:3-oxo-5-alpha-steroid 4-dehydrogenase